MLTPLVEAQIPDQMKAHNMDRETVIREVMLDKQPTKEFVTVEQIAATVAVPVLATPPPRSTARTFRSTAAGRPQ